MTLYIVRRLLQSVLVILIMLVLVFIGVYVIGNPVDVMVSTEADQEEFERMVRLLGLDQPLWKQILVYISKLAQGDLGRSFAFSEPALKLVVQRMPATLELVFVAMTMALAAGIPLGMYTGLHPNSVPARFIMGTSIIGVSIPNFWQGLMLNPYDLRAIDIKDGRLPPGSAKLSRQADIGMTVSIGDRRSGDSPDYDVKVRGRASDAPPGALDLRLAAVVDGTARRFEMMLTPALAGPLDPLRTVQLRGLPRGSELSSGTKDRFRDVWKLTGEQLPGLVITLPASAKDEVRFTLTAAGGVQRHLMTYWLGTDDQGRDMLSAIFYGLRISLSVALVSVLIALSFGTLIGLYAAYHGGRADAVIMRVVDLQLSFPTILVALILLAILGKGVFNVVLALVIVQWALYARTARGVALAERQKEYVDSAACLGLRPARIIVFHILPNCMPSLIVIATLEVAHAISLEATLSFLGLGLPVTQPLLGLLISNGFDYLLSGYPWISVLPGVALLIMVVAINLVGDELRDILNPRLQR